MAGHGPELNKLHDIAHDLLLTAEDELVKVQKATGKTPSELKRVRKALSNIDWNPQAYGDLIENSLAKYGYDHKPLQKAIRRMEEDTMKAYMLLSDDTIHHLVQQRTGGSLRSDPSVIRGAVRRLEDMFGMEFAQSTGQFGNVRGDLSFSNFAHKSDNNASGLERQTIPKNPDPSTTAHAQGTAGFSKALTAAEQADEDALVEALAPRVKAQIDMAENAIITDSPRVQAVRNADPRLADAYKPTNTADDIAAMRPIANSPELRPKIIESYQELITDRGGIRLQRKLAAGAAAAGILALGPLETAASAAEVKNRTEIASETNSFVDKTQAAIAGVSLAGDVASYNPITAIPGTLVSTGADAINVAIDGGRAFLSGDALLNRRKLERQEQLRAKPADAAERENALSVGFAGGM